MKKLIATLVTLAVLAGCSNNEIDHALSLGESAAPVSAEPLETEMVETTESSDLASGDVILPEDGTAYGYMGDTMRTAFLDFIVEDAYTTHEFDGFAPAQGNKYVVVTVKIINTSISTLPMFDDDFELTWDINTTNTDVESVFPVSVLVGEDPSSYDSYETLSDQQLPITYEIGIDDGREGILLFEVPEDATDYLMGFVEYFESGDTGDTFLVAFNATSEE